MNHVSQSLGHQGRQILMRPRDDMRRDEFPQLANGFCTGIHGGRHRRDIAFYNDRDIDRADLFFAHQRDVGGLQHRIRGFENGGESLSFEDAQGFLVGAHNFILVIQTIGRQKLVASAVKRVQYVRKINQSYQSCVRIGDTINHRAFGCTARITSLRPFCADTHAASMISIEPRPRSPGEPFAALPRMTSIKVNAGDWPGKPRLPRAI